MSIWTKLFGAGQRVTSPAAQAKAYREKDNRGTRQETVSQATAYWLARNMQQKFDPFVLYTFADETSAREALLELECMRLAGDSGKIICTETLIFGYYRTDEGKYEAIVCGDDLSYDLWESARSSFARHGGVKRNEKEPAKEKKAPSSRQQGGAREVKFVREDRREQMGHTLIYRIHNGPDAASAKAFLEENPVTRPLYYLVVETPEGNYCRDKDGMYKE